MQPIQATRRNAYTGSPIDRVSHLRDDAAAVAAAWEDARARFAVVWRGRNLLSTAAADQNPVAVWLSRAQVAAFGDRDWALLGLLDGAPVFAIDLSDLEDATTLVPEALGSLVDLRSVAGLLPPAEASMLAHARGLMHWRGRHRFCGVCGGACQPRSAGNAMACTNCQAQHFPRTDPAVIMLVTDGERVLLGHSKRFPNSTMYSTLAGFVEPGESLEEAVAREVFEEAGIRVGHVVYHSSQPWPFPASIMLGFYAEAISHEITIDPAELEDARWFSRDQLRDPQSVGISLPRVDSIARRLIEDWMNHA